ncbi:hypothetical protein CCMSSC00406_0000089 [Pleurotus cornucopiae]|uniref:Uncharacterized protein n=1 Tax=Pleurotus cornucopiae TaxID=5321 RepID=A0ACB7IY87_PLECO|nr:hypothetical protein CCMSSC00406_0000089 [Pleurotus cornucopiae]
MLCVMLGSGVVTSDPLPLLKNQKSTINDQPAYSTVLERSSYVGQPPNVPTFNTQYSQRPFPTPNIPIPQRCQSSTVPAPAPAPPSASASVNQPSRKAGRSNSFLPFPRAPSASSHPAPPSVPYVLVFLIAVERPPAPPPGFPSARLPVRGARPTLI